MAGIKEDKIKELLWNYAQIDGSHHKMWVIDQIARIVYGNQYDEFVVDYEDGGTYEWDCGIAP